MKLKPISAREFLLTLFYEDHPRNSNHGWSSPEYMKYVESQFVELWNELEEIKERAMKK